MAPRPRRPIRPRPSRTVRRPADLPAKLDGFVVGIGGSAGGLEGLRAILAALPKDFPAPVLAVLHVDPDHTSDLAGLLQRGAKMRVKEAKSGEKLVRGTVYLARPDRHLEVHRGRIRLSHAERVHYSRPSIDRLFASMAADAGEHAIAILLSGGGADGAEGMMRVKAGEGTTVVEDSSTAAHPAMPEAAMRTGAVDAVLPIQRIPRFVEQVVAGSKPAIRPSQWGALLDLMRKQTGTDFTGYKPTTLHRRLEKRLLATGQRDLPAYLAFVQHNPEELRSLHSSFLIKMSSFFRDPEAWKQLERNVVKPLTKRAGARSQIRVWSAGCAAGEEAYSLAMAFLDHLPPEAKPGLKVFATDIDEGALETARHGLYDAAQIATVSAEQRRTYFTQEGRMYRVRKNLRKHVIFGRHDLTSDPPIAGLDLIACRNVVIYLNPEQKRNVMHQLAYAVKPGGYLFLGKSEGLGEYEEMFEDVNQKVRIFRKNARYLPPAVARARPSAERAEEQVRAATRAGEREIKAEQTFHHLLLESASVMLVTLDEQRQVTLWNKAAERFFGTPPEAALGKPVFEAMDGLSTDRLGRGLKEAQQDDRTVKLRGLAVRRPGVPIKHIDLDVTPLVRRGHNGKLLLVAVDVSDRHESDARQRDLTQKLRKAISEATRANESLQAGNEELETLNEELQSAAEEQQTLNEELQATNEELETTNEELQSTNEELNTLNEEMRARSEELERLSAYLRAILDAAPESILACNATNEVTFWSLAATRIFRISEPQAVGQSLFVLLPSLDTGPMRQAIQKALADRKPQVVDELPVGASQGRVRVLVSPVADRADRARGYILLASHVNSDTKS